MKNYYLLFSLALLFVSCSKDSTEGPDTDGTDPNSNGGTEEITTYDGMQLVWNDEFDYDGAPSASKWHLQTLPIFGGGWANNELQHYTDRTSNAQVSNGTLKITAKRESYTFENSTKSYTSARLNSKYELRYGRIDVRAKLPTSAGLWPAIWTLGSNINERGGYFQPTQGTTSWPACGEIDLMEKRGYQNDRVLGTFHWKDDTSGDYAVYSEYKTIANIGADFHLYSLVWNAAVLQIYVDNQLIIQMTNTESEFKAAHYLLLNLAVGGTLGGEVPSSFSQGTMEVDYVRFYQAQ